MKYPTLLALSALTCLGATPALADIEVGVTISATGPAASLGIAEKNTIALLPTQVGGEKIHYTILDDASDTTQAVKNVRKLIAEDKVDVILGSTTTPNSLAMVDVAAGEQVAMVAFAPIAEPVDPKKQRWIFRTPQSEAQMTALIAAHMKKAGVKTVAFIGFSDAYGDNWLKNITVSLQAQGIQLVSTERFNRADTSVSGQVLKTLTTRPDAVFIAASGTPAALPQKTLKERGFAGKIYQTHGVANQDFLRVCGKDCDGAFLPVGPMLVADQLPASSPVKKAAQAYVGKYEAAYGKGSTSMFGGYAWDAGQLLINAFPVALKTAKPGTPAFRAALRDALEASKEVAGVHGVYSLSPGNHLGQDERSRVMVQISAGKWVLVP